MKNNQNENRKRSESGNRNLPGKETHDLVAVRITCRVFCEHFKGSGGEAACGGFSAVLRALESGMITDRQMERISNRPPPLPARIRFLKDKLCATCGYLEDGCDFQSAAPPEGCTPCGGYRILQILLESGEIGEEELEKVLSGLTSNV